MKNIKNSTCDSPKNPPAAVRSKMTLLAENAGQKIYSVEPRKFDPTPFITSFVLTSDSVVATAIISYEPGTRSIQINWGHGSVDTIDVSPDALSSFVASFPTNAPSQPENTILVQHIYPELPKTNEQMSEKGLSFSSKDYESDTDFLSNLKLREKYTVRTSYLSSDYQIRSGPMQDITITPRYRFTLFPIQLGFAAQGYEGPSDTEAEFDVSLNVEQDIQVLKENYWDIVVGQVPIWKSTIEQSGEYWTNVELTDSAGTYEISYDSLQAIRVIVTAKERDSKWTDLLNDAWGIGKYFTEEWWTYKTLEKVYKLFQYDFDGSVENTPGALMHRFGWHPAWGIQYSNSSNNYVRIVATVDSHDGTVDVLLKTHIKLIADYYKRTPPSLEQ